HSSKSATGCLASSPWATRRASSSSKCATTSRAGRRSSRPPTSKWSELLRRRQRSFIDHFDALWRHEPRMRRAQPGEAARLDRSRLIQRADADRPHAGKRLRGPRDLRAAARTELEAQPPSAFVRAVLVGLERAAQDANFFFLEV